MIERYKSTLKYYWRYLAHRRLNYCNQHRKLDWGFLIPDPWDMQSEREKARFVETNGIIKRHFGRQKRLLEIGSAEGHQSRYLIEVCDELVGTDVSERALTRARRCCPLGTFLLVDILSDNCDLQLESFDLVVACEVLYYVRDVPLALKRMEKLGRHCLVTFCDPEAEVMLEHMKLVPLAGRDLIRHGETTWHVMWWQSRDLSVTR